ncbi:hypothetical protein [Sphingopyxis sp.]|uniref:hypothetical protein n=1 Tax=Sphingopyxis sp. TaxID=1908224 RepID=UPI0025D58C4D|nr:hypothetical protein [Sphingopyxis sp.]MBK6411686.1 hypothetical protein [Sphingopyxis sp.]
MTRKLTPVPPPANDAAKAFDDLRSEISLQRSAIEGLTSAKEKLPDYLPTLRDMGARLDQIDQHIASIHDKPAMRLTPLTLAAESHQASMAFSAEYRKSVGDASRRAFTCTWPRRGHDQGATVERRAGLVGDLGGNRGRPAWRIHGPDRRGDLELTPTGDGCVFTRTE